MSNHHERYRTNLSAWAERFICLTDSLMNTRGIGALLRRSRGELLALAILVPLVVVLGAILVRWPREIAREVVTPTPLVSTAPATVASIAASPTSSPAAIAAPAATQSVQLAIESPNSVQNFDISVSSPLTVAAILDRAQRENGLAVETKDYGGSLGLFIEALNGVHNDSAKQLYWHLYINGQRSPLGASNAVAQPGDAVTWKFEAASEEE